MFPYEPPRARRPRPAARAPFLRRLVCTLRRHPGYLPVEVIGLSLGYCPLCDRYIGNPRPVRPPA